MQFWNELEGKVTEDGYRLGRLVRSEGRTAWFETETQDGAPEPAIISLTESLTDAEEVTERLQAAQRLQHPNLMAILKTGHTRLDQTVFVYALLEHADQNLADILRGQALSKEEARQVAEAMVSGLTVIHQQGLVHGRVEPASVLAVGETVKLRSDCLQTPGGTRAGDVAGIGDTLFQVFFQRKPSSAEDPQINRIPAPMGEIVRNSLSSRWGLVQVAAVLRPAAGAAAAGTAPMPRPPVTPPVVPPPPAAPKPPSVAPTSPANGEARTPRGEELKDQEAEEELDHARTGRSTAIYASVAIVLLLILGWLLLRHKAPQRSAAASAPSVAQNASAPAAPLPAPTPAPVKPRAVKPPAPVAAKPSPQQGGAAASTSNRTVWRVVAYTYRHHDQAQQKADEINRDHPGLDAAAYSPQGDSEHYLVVLGGAMDRQQASAMRDKARSEGLADDTYVQNFSE
jgi:eukaryotic-like serine/threonine-protein kinase